MSTDKGRASRQLLALLREVPRAPEPDKGRASNKQLLALLRTPAGPPAVPRASEPGHAKKSHNRFSLHSHLKHLHKTRHAQSDSASTASSSGSTDSSDKNKQNRHHHHHDHHHPKKSDDSSGRGHDHKHGHHKPSDDHEHDRGKQSDDHGLPRHSDGHTEKKKSDAKPGTDNKKDEPDAIFAKKSVNQGPALPSESSSSSGSPDATVVKKSVNQGRALPSKSSLSSGSNTRINNAGGWPANLNIDDDKTRKATATGLVADAGGDTIFNADHGIQAHDDGKGRAPPSLIPFAVAEISMTDQQQKKSSDGQFESTISSHSQSTESTGSTEFEQPNVPQQKKKKAKKQVSSSEEETSDEDENHLYHHQQWQHHQQMLHHLHQQQAQMNYYGNGQNMMGGYQGQPQYPYPGQQMYQQQQIMPQQQPMTQQQPMQQHQAHQMAQIGIMPMRSMAFDAPYVPLRSEISPHLRPQACSSEEDEGEDGKVQDPNCCSKDDLEDGVEFSYRPRPHCRTEVTFTIEPKRQPKWLTMMNCGFRPVVNCTAPPCYLTPNNNPGMQICGGKMVNNTYTTPFGQNPQHQYPTLPTLPQLQNSFQSSQQNHSRQTHSQPSVHNTIVRSNSHPSTVSNTTQPSQSPTLSSMSSSSESKALSLSEYHSSIEDDSDDDISIARTDSS